MGPVRTAIMGPASRTAVSASRVAVPAAARARRFGRLPEAGAAP